jgi:hypothetical protein
MSKNPIFSKKRFKQKDTDSINQTQFWVTHTVQIVIAIIGIYALWESIKSREAAQKSAQVAFESLKLQKDQLYDIRIKDSLQDIQDSVKYVKNTELTQRQINALKIQATALSQGVRYNEYTQRPIVEIKRIGYVQPVGKTNFNLIYELINVGERQCYLQEVKLFMISSDLKHIDTINIPLSGRKVLKKEITHFRELVHNEKHDYSINDLRNEKDFYISIGYRYFDEMINKQFVMPSDSIILKWDQSTPNTQNGNIDSVTGETYFAFYTCSGSEKQRVKEFLRQKKSKTIKYNSHK